MKKLIFTAALLAVSSAASSMEVFLAAHNQRSSSGSLSTLKWAGCSTFATWSPCINPANPNLTAMGMTASTAVWDFTGGVLTGVGSFNTASTLGSSGSAAASAVIGDKVMDLVIDTNLSTTSATSYSCAEGNFLGGVGAHGCMNISLGGDFLNNSSVAYNVGGAANCVNRTVGGDDVSTGNPRGLFSAIAGGGCDAVDGAFNNWTIVSNTLGSGGYLVLSNGVPIGSAGTNYLTFSATPIPGAVWLFGSALGLIGVIRRRAAA